MRKHSSHRPGKYIDCPVCVALQRANAGHEKSKEFLGRLLRAKKETMRTESNVMKKEDRIQLNQRWKDRVRFQVGKQQDDSFIDVVLDGDQLTIRGLDRLVIEPQVSNQIVVRLKK